MLPDRVSQEIRGIVVVGDEVQMRTRVRGSDDGVTALQRFDEALPVGAARLARESGEVRSSSAQTMSSNVSSGDFDSSAAMSPTRRPT